MIRYYNYVRRIGLRFILRKQIINKFLNFHYFCLVCCDCVNNDWNASINTNYRQICHYTVEYTGIRTFNYNISAFENDRNIICFKLSKVIKLMPVWIPFLLISLHINKTNVKLSNGISFINQTETFFF